MSDPMNGEARSFADDVRELAASARRAGGGAEPTPEELFAYLDGELTAEEEERLQSRLALHPESTGALLDLERLARMEEDPGPAGAGEQPSWESMRARIAAEPPSTVERAAGDRLAAVVPAPVPAAAFPAEGRRPSVRGRAAGGWFWPALAASWLVALALGAGVASLYRDSVPGAPVPNVYHFDLLPEGAHIRRAPDADAVVVPAPARRFVLVLTIADPGSFPEYRLRVLDRVGEPVAEVSGLLPSAKGTFNVELARGHLPAGRYSLRLEGVAGTAHEPVADYRLDLGYE